jgi:hypothetical protein
MEIVIEFIRQGIMKGSYVSHKGKVWQKAGLYRVKKESSKTVR